VGCGEMGGLGGLTSFRQMNFRLNLPRLIDWSAGWH
jgi:hypothetical protein